jgi:hypothetical protein
MIFKAELLFCLGSQNGMHTKAILSLTFIMLSRLSGSKLLRVAQRLQEKCLELLRRIDRLEAEIGQLQEELKKQKVKSVNEGANKPSSKQAEWDKKGVGNDGKGKTGKKGRGKKPRKGAGNRCKTVAVDRKEKATVDHCSLCGKDLLDEKPLESSNTRIIEETRLCSCPE